MTTQAGWYDNPEHPGQWRYWDGMAWTSHVHGSEFPNTPAAGARGTASWFARHRVATGLLAGIGLLTAVGLVVGGDGPVEPVPVAATTPVPLTAPPEPTPATTPKPPADADGDGVPDGQDDFPDDPARSSAQDRDGDGVDNAEDYDPDDPAVQEEPDSDGDGVKDGQDVFPNDAARSSDRDRDGVADEDDVLPDDPTRSVWDSGAVTRVVDGDTIEVDGQGTVRVIGIDTPEQGECGYDEATRVMSEMVLGQTVTLVPGARDDRDRYDRLLRYVDLGDTDTGLAMIASGLAIARYDSRDGYGRHTREDPYVAADQASPDRTQAFCPAPPPPPAQPAPAPVAPPSVGTCDPSYQGVCIPPSPPDLDCGQISERNFAVIGADPHRFDGDGDGVGCES